LAKGQKLFPPVSKSRIRSWVGMVPVSWFPLKFLRRKLTHIIKTMGSPLPHNQKMELCDTYKERSLVKFPISVGMVP